MLEAMPYPNKLQWVIIWVTVLLAAHLWIGLRVHDFWPGNAAGGWGLPAYLEGAWAELPANPDASPRFAVCILAIGSLLVWMASPRRGRESR